jgi:hypothetical protein
VNAFTRALAALATLTLLSVDDIEAPRKATMTITISKADQNQACQSGPVNLAHRKPCGIDPVEWARYNASQNRTLAELSGLPAPEPGVLELAPYEVEVRTRIPGPLDELLGAVNRAAGELQHGGARENRIAVQLLTAAARFEAEIGAQ